MSYEELNKQLEPFKLMVFDEGTEDVWATLVLWLNDDYKQNVFDTRQEEGFIGNGYDWNSLAIVFLEEKMPELMEVLSFDSEAGSGIVLNRFRRCGSREEICYRI